jgi:hypothetical protein
MPLTQQEWTAALAEHSNGFAEAAGGKLNAPVAFCPGWTVRHVVHHLTQVTDRRIQRKSLSTFGHTILRMLTCASGRG